MPETERAVRPDLFKRRGALLRREVTVHPAVEVVIESTKHMVHLLLESRVPGAVSISEYGVTHGNRVLSCAFKDRQMTDIAGDGLDHLDAGSTGADDANAYTVSSRPPFGQRAVYAILSLKFCWVGNIGTSGADTIPLQRTKNPVLNVSP